MPVRKLEGCRRLHLRRALEKEGVPEPERDLDLWPTLRFLCIGGTRRQAVPSGSASSFNQYWYNNKGFVNAGPYRMTDMTRLEVGSRTE
jgi:hypothetical protein